MELAEKLQMAQINTGKNSVRQSAPTYERLLKMQLTRNLNQ